MLHRARGSHDIGVRLGVFTPLPMRSWSPQILSLSSLQEDPGQVITTCKHMTTTMKSSTHNTITGPQNHTQPATTPPRGGVNPWLPCRFEYPCPYLLGGRAASLYGCIKQVNTCTFGWCRKLTTSSVGGRGQCLFKVRHARIE